MGTSIKTQATQTHVAVARQAHDRLWPIRYKPLPDELLSCWLVRLAHGHGMKVQTFCNVIFGERLQVWNRDIDRLAPPWLLNEMSVRTGTPYPATASTTLRAYEGLLYRKFRSAGPLHWMLVLQMYHRKRLGFGLQYCPTCLSKDYTPYFRKCWRLALNTVCSAHNTLLQDRCPRCGAAVVPHRVDFSRFDPLADVPVSVCHQCDFDLRTAPAVEPIYYDSASSNVMRDACNDVDAGATRSWSIDRYVVFHQLCKIMTTRYKHAGLRDFVLNEIGARDIVLTQGHVSFEMRPIQERHHVLQLTAWLFVNLEPRLHAAWDSGAVRYSLLTKDLRDIPDWYEQIVSKFVNWRARNTKIGGR